MREGNNLGKSASIIGSLLGNMEITNITGVKSADFKRVVLID